MNAIYKVIALLWILLTIGLAASGGGLPILATGIVLAIVAGLSFQHDRQQVATSIRKKSEQRMNQYLYEVRAHRPKEYKTTRARANAWFAAQDTKADSLAEGFTLGAVIFAIGCFAVGPGITAILLIAYYTGRIFVRA